MLVGTSIRENSSFCEAAGDNRPVIDRAVRSQCDLPSPRRWKWSPPDEDQDGVTFHSAWRVLFPDVLKTNYDQQSLSFHFHELVMKFPVSAILVLCCAIEGVAGCKPASKSTVAADSPASVTKVKQESALNEVVLKPEAEQRLGVQVAPVALRTVSRVRSYAGEIALPPGASLIINAPFGGRISAPCDAVIPPAGTLVAAKQPICLLTPLLSPERDVLTPAERISMAQAKNTILTTRIEAAGQVAQATEQVTAAKVSLDRAERLWRDAAGTAKTVDDAKAQLNMALAALAAAEARQRAADSISLEGSEPGQQTPLTMESPQTGMIRSQQIAAGEVVAAGGPLFEVTKYDPVWVRVPVYAGELDDLALDRPAEVARLNAEGRQRGLIAKPITAPPTATAVAATVDLYYELANPEGKLRPGERMAAKIRLQGTSEQPVVPWSAIMRDIHGGTWVYEKIGEHTYVSRRVLVRYVVDESAVLASGPPVGAQIVTAGAVELWGTEFGFAK